MPTISTIASGISPTFPVTGEEFKYILVQSLTKVNIDGVSPPAGGEHGGYSHAMSFVNKWFPWIDEKIIEPKYDGVCQFLGVPSNRPTLVKDFHIIALYRAVDYILAPSYLCTIETVVDPVTPNGPPLA